MAPAVLVRKSGKNLALDYRDPNKKMIKDAYRLPSPDEVQDRLAGSKL